MDILKNLRLSIADLFKGKGKHQPVDDIKDYNSLSLMVLGDGFNDDYRLSENPNEFPGTPELDEFKESLIGYLTDTLGYQIIYDGAYNRKEGRNDRIAQITELSRPDSSILMYVDSTHSGFFGVGTDDETLHILVDSENYKGIVSDMETAFPNLKIFNKKFYTPPQMDEMTDKIEGIKTGESGYYDLNKPRPFPTITLTLTKSTS